MSIRVYVIQRWVTSVFLLETETGLFLVDTGFPGTEGRILRKMRELRRDDLRLIFLTHGHLDHYGSAAALRRLTGAPVAIHRADADAMAQGKTPIRSAHYHGRLVLALLPWIEKSILNIEPTPADVLLDDGDNLSDYGLDAVVVHTPGHSPGSSCLLVEGLAFTGDLFASPGPLRPQYLYADDWALIPQSIARLQQFQPEWVYRGHATRPVSGEVLQKLKVPKVHEREIL